MSVPSGIRLREPAAVFESATVAGSSVPSTRLYVLPVIDGGGDAALVGERVEERAVVRVDQGEPVGRAVLRVAGDDEERARSERARQGLAVVLLRVGAVDEDEREPGEVDRGRAGVLQLDEAVAVRSHLVVVHLVDDEAAGGRRRRWRRRRRRRAARDAAEEHRVVAREVELDGTGLAAVGRARDPGEVAELRQARRRGRPSAPAARPGPPALPGRRRSRTPPARARGRRSPRRRGAPSRRSGGGRRR